MASRDKGEEQSPQDGGLVLTAACLLCCVLGSIHAFSVFLEPMEQRFELSRAHVSLTYSFALVTLTLAVLTGHRTFHRLPPPRLVILACALAAAGALLAAWAPSLSVVWFGYSFLFGGANGLGYGFSLLLSAQTNPGREGRAMGIVTASYALGATLAPPLFSWGLAVGGMPVAMTGLAVTLILIAPVCALLLHKANAVFKTPDDDRQSSSLASRTIGLLWLAYGAAVAAGLMAIGHATGIAKHAGLREALWIAPMTIAICNLVGSYIGGLLVDRTSPWVLLTGLPLLSATALALLTTLAGNVAPLGALGCIGFAYGAIIAVYPAVIEMHFANTDSTRVYGKVFTAWGTAGLCAPWLAGALFDKSGAYTLALIVAAALSCVSVVCVGLLFRTTAVR